MTTLTSKTHQGKNRRRTTSVAALGMEKSTLNIIQSFFQSKYNNYILAGDTTADISILDMDGLDSATMLQQHKVAYPTRPLILISVRNIKSEKEIFVKKPINVSALTQALSDAVIKLYFSDSESIYRDTLVEPPILGYRNNADPAWQIIPKPKRKQIDPEYKNWSSRSLDSLVEASESGLHLMPEEFKKDAVTEKLLLKSQYDPKNMLQGYFKKAYDTALVSRCNVKLEGPWRPLTILMNQHKVSVESNFRHIFALSAMNFEPKQVAMTLLPKNTDDANHQNGITQSIEQFFWKLCLRTSRGKVPVGTDLHVRILLRQWPNFTRTAMTPHALRIAALWSKQPTSLLETAVILNISLSFVFAFYSSARPLNLLSHLRDTQPTNRPSTKIDDHSNRKMFDGRVDKLKNNIDVGQ